MSWRRNPALTNSRAACAAAEQTPQVRGYKTRFKAFLKFYFIFGGEETEEALQMQEEDEDETWEETPSLPAPRSVIICVMVTISVPQMSSPGASTSDVIINVEQE